MIGGMSVAIDNEVQIIAYRQILMQLNARTGIKTAQMMVLLQVVIIHIHIGITQSQIGIEPDIIDTRQVCPDSTQTSIYHSVMVGRLQRVPA